ncbi:DUF6138 family protein [Chitinophaga nivalis]|uniref:DUF6138 family protein n=1 Tax=Chitinophaga nivalis TaxID=2991709 RepID=A0ABT3IPP3_9BACT|nr:DUF6138 family protein [Chitinophaga nivalis]MCW3464554.1 DUF6138 family protein [Chitinophaga nivalis]MCW3485755.1 DUF6138 family protein [Chitinophaga nivalis]
MNNWVETIANDITATVKSLLEKMLQKNLEDITGRTTLQIGVYDTIFFKYVAGKVKGYTEEWNSSRPDLLTEGTLIDPMPSQAAITSELLPYLQSQLQELIATCDHHPVLEYRFRISGTIQAADGICRVVVLDHINTNKKATLLKRITEYVTHKIDELNYPTRDLDTHFLARHLVDNRLYPTPDIPWIIRIFDRIQELNKNNREKLAAHRQAIRYQLQQWAENTFLPVYFDITPLNFGQKTYQLKTGAQAANDPQTDLLIYTAVMIIKYEPNYSRPTGIGFMERAQELGSTRAAAILQHGSESFLPADRQYSDEHLTAAANDIFGTVHLTIKKESAIAYSEALDFIIRLLQKGFPLSYAIKLKSATKNVLPLKGIGKSGTHIFFANALQYPELHEKTAQYARLAIREQYEWYTDVEAEQCAMPGTYAVFGLALASPEWFPLLTEYMAVVDAEHQSVQNAFIGRFIEQYGIDASTIPVLVLCLLRAQDNKPFKQLAAIDTPPYLEILLPLLQGMESYEVEHVAWFIWGGKDKLTTVAKKHPDRQTYLEAILKMIG